MSDTTADGPDEPVSMNKPSRPARPAPVRFIPARVPRPTTVTAAMGVLGIALVGVILRAFGWVTVKTPQLQKYLEYANSKAKTPKKDYVPGNSAFQKDLSSVRHFGIELGVIGVVMILLVLIGLTRTRYASMTRWLMIIGLYFAGAIAGLSSPPKYQPGMTTVGGYLLTIGTVLALVLLFAPVSSRQYFAKCREESLPPERRGQQRPSLFGPRPPAGQPRGTAPNRPQTRQPSAARETGAPSRAKSKARSDADAVARGAELARTRARASKSRRTDV